MDKTRHIILPPYFTPARIAELAEVVPVHIDRALLFYSYLMYRNLNEADKSNLNFKESRVSPFHRVHSDLLKVIFGRATYKPILSLLEANQLLEIDHSYCHGIQSGTHKVAGYSKSYKIPNKLVSKVFDNCMLKYQLNDQRTINAKQKLLDHIRSRKINTIKLQDTAKQILLDSINKINTDTLPEHKRYDLVTGPCMDRFGKRLHSAVTNLKKSYRADLRFQNSDEALTELDITSSQMYFFANLSEGVLDHDLNAIDATRVNELIKELLTCQGYILFKQTVLYGDKDIYQEMADNLDISRDSAKQAIFKIFFGTQYINLEREMEYFDEQYPGLINKISSFKEITLKESPSNKRHANLTLILQRMESNMVLNETIIAAAEQGITDILTIHDSWLVKESQAELFQSVLTEVFMYAFGNVPKFKIKTYAKKKDSQMIESPVCM